MKHYEEMLYIGKEVRSEGLIWIIKAMWKLGQNVPMSFMPTFLDFKSIEYLFKSIDFCSFLYKINAKNKIKK